MFFLNVRNILCSLNKKMHVSKICISISIFHDLIDLNRLFLYIKSKNSTSDTFYREFSVMNSKSSTNSKNFENSKNCNTKEFVNAYCLIISFIAFCISKIIAMINVTIINIIFTSLNFDFKSFSFIKTVLSRFFFF